MLETMIGSRIGIVNPDPIEDYMNGVHVIVSNKQPILMIPMNHSPISMRNNLEANESKVFVFIKNAVVNYVIVKISYLIEINHVDASS